MRRAKWWSSDSWGWVGQQGFCRQFHQIPLEHPWCVALRRYGDVVVAVEGEVELLVGQGREVAAEVIHLWQGQHMVHGGESHTPPGGPPPPPGPPPAPRRGGGGPGPPGGQEGRGGAFAE